ncbi:FecR family protein [Steroidobacter sp.]|uniref:FecR family protein n=1 Tax=Steroidobacter sp. TaxID=1978227 RepID=UPI001A555416|nr:FecR domain-containing protein [Steroidobacter sp.]MBL8270018.1 FecR domain-containing protein [Steroidobacter sp.]
MSASENNPSKAQIAEAAAWVAHLHGAKRSAGSNRGLQLWLKEDPARQRAWEVATEVWDEVGNLQGAAIAKALDQIAPHQADRKKQRARFVALAAAASLAALAVLFWLRGAGVSTGIGEQRILALADGTRVTLNTDTRIVVDYDETNRTVELKSGEARFDVAKEHRPFLAVAGDRQVRALGTSFVVRYEPEQRTTVMLVEGKVSVSPRKQSHPALAEVVTLSPGQRLTFDTNAAPRIDRPSLDDVIAWQRGQVVLEGTRLADAVVEMNRYSTKVLTIEQPRAEDLVISGVFQSGDSSSFAKAVAYTYHLNVVTEGDTITLSGNPQAAYRKRSEK